MTKKYKYTTVIGIYGAILAMSSIVNAEIRFDNVTKNAGPFHHGESWGASWGDYNGDGRPDLYVSNHRNVPSIYQNFIDQNNRHRFRNVIVGVSENIKYK